MARSFPAVRTGSTPRRASSHSNGSSTRTGCGPDFGTSAGASAGGGASSEHGATAPLEAALSDEPIPSVPLPLAGPWRSYKEILAALAQRVLDAQRPIRVLQALRWDAGDRPEWRRHRAWHLDAIGSEGFHDRRNAYPDTVDNNPVLRSFYDHHLPFYERLLQHAD